LFIDKFGTIKFFVFCHKKQANIQQFVKYKKNGTANGVEKQII